MLSLTASLLSLLPSAPGAVEWHDARSLLVEGQGWTQATAPYARLPDRAEKLVRPAVWKLSRHSSGLVIRFLTDAREVHARWVLTSPSLAMPHMAATGVSGVDLYVRSERSWRWLAVGKPTGPRNEVRLVRGLEPARREYALYLPLYNGVSEVAIGVPAGAKISKARSATKEPIVFYGTSITQGGCASRPGTVHPAVLGRRLGRPVINLGFSGNGRMEPELGELLTEISASLYVIDCCPNLSGDQAGKRLGPLIRILRAKRPHTPVLVVEDRTYSNAFLVPARRRRNEENRRALRAGYEALVAADVKKLHYLEGNKLLGLDGDDTVDGSHPTDLGFFRQAAAFEPLLRRILH